MIPADGEPTEADMAAAKWLAVAYSETPRLRQELIAQALASQRAEIHARYAGIADALAEDNPRRQWIADAIKTIGKDGAA